MAEFLTTRGISLYIEEIIKTAEKQITIVTPYLKFSKVLFERLLIADKKNIPITIIYGKTELSKEQDIQLKKLSNLNLYFLEHLHAKCYFNEDLLVITSMNLYQFSEENNWEMGVLLKMRTDRNAFKDALNEIASIKLASKAIQTNQNSQIENSKVEYDWEDFSKAYFNTLTNKYTNAQFSISGRDITAIDFPLKGFRFDNQNGFGNIWLNCSKDKGKYLKEKFANQIYEALSDYRVYWNYPFEKISIYHAKGIEFTSLEEDVKYCLNGLELMKEEVNTMLNK